MINIYIDTNASSVEEWFEWRNAITPIRFETSESGTGHATKASLCTLCHGVDHPNGLCPFSTIPGWYGPKDKDKDTKRGRHYDYDYNPRGKGRGQGRGNGRGRGRQ